ncbi:predicted protein [Arabidopsis lyrata subsp. lyrata]|uniref:Predicted protein n=1 Tax=Arabidopsis lyrata subsp. lyrata TaxID=81972 RepID=D7MU63_ARALL|nr:predicted protein [Arabidopsis lyrata subsp. lyrata]
MQRPKATKTKKKRIGEVMTDVVNLEEAEEAVGDLVQDVQKFGDIAAEEVVGGPVQEVQKFGDVAAEEANGDPDQTVSEKEVANTSQQPAEQVDAQDDDETVEPMAVETDNMNQDSQPVASEPNAREDDSHRTDAGTEMRSTSGLGTPQGDAKLINNDTGKDDSKIQLSHGDPKQAFDRSRNGCHGWCLDLVK